MKTETKTKVRTKSGKAATMSGPQFYGQAQPQAYGQLPPTVDDLPRASFFVGVCTSQSNSALPRKLVLFSFRLLPPTSLQV